MSDCRGARGFTLLEVLVAFVIAALVLGALFRGGVAGLATTRASERTQEALSRARSHLAAVADLPVIAAREEHGEDGGGFDWRVRVSEIGRAKSLGGSQFVALYAVSSTVSWQDGAARRAVRLDTERMTLLASGGGP